jgi:hypothetical protein
MKIEQLLVQHFFIAKEVTLQGMGTFTLSPDFVMPSEKDKDSQIPDNSISFQYNSRAAEDDALIGFIVQQTRKMKALASADLDSYLVLGKQFLNIGKPFKIEGLGLLVKNQQGEYEFTQGHSFNSKNEEPTAALKEKHDEDEISFGSENKKTPGSSKKGLLIAAIVIGLGMTGAAAWYFLVKNKNNKTEQVTENPAVKQDSAPVTKAISDSLTKKADSTTTVLVPPTNNNGYTFKVVIKNYPSLLPAQRAYDRLTSYGHKLLLYTSDSVIFKVALPLNTPLSDTTRARDSVRQLLFGGNPYVELK